MNLEKTVRNNPFQWLYDICNQECTENGEQITTEFPVVMDIELTNFCNFQCLMCPTGTKSFKRKQGYMSIEVFDKIINEIIGKNVGLRFIRWGEPSLHKQFIPFLHKAKEAGILCHVNSNGSLLTEEMLNDFVDMKLDSIKFSFQGIDEESYNQMRVNGNFDTLIQTVQKLFQLRGNQIEPFIHVASTITYETQEQVDAFRNVLKDYCDIVTIGRTNLDFVEIENVKLSPEQKKSLIQLKDQETYTKVYPTICPEVFAKTSINWDGKITACCTDYDEMMVVGDINQNTLDEIWKSPKYKAYRKILNAKEYEKIELCRKCYDAMGIQAFQNRIE